MSQLHRACGSTESEAHAAACALDGNAPPAGWSQGRATDWTQEITTALRCIAKDDKSGVNGSPTIFVDEATADFVIQGWRIDEDTEAECRAAGPIPDHETVVRIPARMVKAMREACDVAERGELR
ncbi:hypothetical protein [Streptacidiphilus sp. EB129]|uniref:hypothetical protein n=1 Tax=Streptacidiphilus sp. EB129 TaxID=3156262 RepID=UPI003516F0CD